MFLIRMICLLLGTALSVLYLLMMLRGRKYDSMTAHLENVENKDLCAAGFAMQDIPFLALRGRLGKELRVSAIVGAVLGIVNGLRIYLMYTFLFPGQYANVMGYAIVVSVSLFFSVILAKIVGGMLPLAAKKLGADPAIMATPFITTIVDACSLILYFQIAQLVFRNMM